MTTSSVPLRPLTSVTKQLKVTSAAISEVTLITLSWMSSMAVLSRVHVMLAIGIIVAPELLGSSAWHFSVTMELIVDSNVLAVKETESVSENYIRPKKEWFLLTQWMQSRLFCVIIYTKLISSRYRIRKKLRQSTANWFNSTFLSVYRQQTSYLTGGSLDLGLIFLRVERGDHGWYTQQSRKLVST